MVVVSSDSVVQHPGLNSGHSVHSLWQHEIQLSYQLLRNVTTCPLTYTSTYSIKV